jgi:hypothetical protein
VPTPVGLGIDFVGWKTYWDHRVPRRRTLGGLVNRVRRFARTALRPALGGRSRAVAHRASLASYSGHLRHGAAAAAWARLWREHPWLGVLYSRQGWQLFERWPRPPRGASFGRQYRDLVRGAGADCLVYCRVGRFVEFYGPQRVTAQAALGLRLVAMPRAGYLLAAGFPARLSEVYRDRALARGYLVAEVRELAVVVEGHPRRREVFRLSLPLVELATLGDSSWAGQRAF